MSGMEHRHAFHAAYRDYLQTFESRLQESIEEDGEWRPFCEADPPMSASPARLAGSL